MRIAIVGAGISGLSAAYALKDTHDVTLFEREPRLGGHANTLTVDYDGARIPVDTGFMVFNTLTYPNLCALFEHLGVETVASDMSFSVSAGAGREWSSNGLGGVFAWKRNLASPAFLCMLGDIVRFSAQARADLQERTVAAATLEQYVARLKLGDRFLRNYLLPMGAAIWSTPERDMLRYPAETFLRFCDNHRLLHAKRPKWRTVAGGSQTYVAVLKNALGKRVRAGAPVASARRSSDGIALQTADGSEHAFDHVVFACHADEAAAILADEAPAVRTALLDMRTAPNTAYLHRDAALMPRRRAAWASWNYLKSSDGRVCVTYWMNKLQDIDPARPLFVTLNPVEPPAPEKTFARLTYNHPQFDAAALRAQSILRGLQGQDGIWFAGAWLGYGFHEDGAASGLAVAQALGASAPWRAHGAAATKLEAAA